MQLISELEPTQCGQPLVEGLLFTDSFSVSLSPPDAKPGPHYMFCHCGILDSGAGKGAGSVLSAWVLLPEYSRGKAHSQQGQLTTHLLCW